MMQPTQPFEVRGLRAIRRARGGHHQVTDEPAPHASFRPGQGRSDEQLPDTRRDNRLDRLPHSPAAVLGPLALMEVAMSEILDPVTAQGHQSNNRTQHREPAENPGRSDRHTLQRRSRVRATQAHQPRHQRQPRHPTRFGLMQRAPRHQATHRVSDQDDLGDRDGHAATSSHSSPTSSRPLSEMCRPVLYRTYTGLQDKSWANRLPKSVPVRALPGSIG